MQSLGALFERPVYSHLAPAHFFIVVEGQNRSFGLLGRAVLNECVTLGIARFAVEIEDAVLDFAVVRKGVHQVFLAGLFIKTCNANYKAVNGLDIGSVALNFQLVEALSHVI